MGLLKAIGIQQIWTSELWVNILTKSYKSNNDMNRKPDKYIKFTMKGLCSRTAFDVDYEVINFTFERKWIYLKY
jgi:hypothetical protein